MQNTRGSARLLFRIHGPSGLVEFVIKSDDSGQAIWVGWGIGTKDAEYAVVSGV